MEMKKLLLILACAAALTAQTAPTQLGIIEGTVLRDGTSEPIAGVKITIGGVGQLIPPQAAEAILDAEARGQYIPPELIEEALARASAGARPIPSGPTATTDADGHFVVKDVSVGNAPVYAQLEGYFASPI